MSVDIHIFNPETDYALAAGRRVYNPPRQIAEFRKRMALFPATYARPGDWIAVDDDVTDFHPAHLALVKAKKLTVIPISSLANHSSPLTPDYKPPLTPNSSLLTIKSSPRISPWGWNHTLRLQLLKAGVSEGLLKTDGEIDTLRSLSHRRTSAEIQLRLRDLLPDLQVDVAQEFFSVGEALAFLENQPISANGRHTAYFKLPWSSSGRGVVKADDFPVAKMEQWISGGIRRQGSVTGERAFDRACDFATEWDIHDGRASFLGLSVFRTSAEGRYEGNLVKPQDILWEKIASHCPQWSQKVIDAQKSALEEVVAGGYSGPAGIDMLATSDGSLVPCVEVNLRQTMGRAALLSIQ